ncbi:hydroxyethylthiazole kinase-like uncharacterized protein yjeF/hydroxyethylthiazole kinase-like uncharacterized protein yjeF [Balneicella halophila]|uniref:Bifunctional NAD(P)H-hydrate repair enzyme n=1 Tax=Balneicella halophila TaxID=1537566 RepID=A0A7L4URV7_BALHA|nr:NAD(P)H-hydrate dehydratase [Balneicella halophila]PVX52490.1 hydroxyethylthiazole kinase-like uncharacterized protein yjeF/hydroxyethylthiazole kinase-like uncharacterized protein yjeF [Balneicella halophila]
MKILSPKQIAEADHYTIKNEPISPVNLMERAATKCFEWISSNFENTKSVKVFCGTGNNGGDGLVIARLLKNKGFSVKTFILPLGNKQTEEFSINLKRLDDVCAKIVFIEKQEDLPKLSPRDLIIDAIFGNGLNRAPEGLSKNLIQYINEAKATVIAIDIPSGLFSGKSVTAKDSVIKAHHTLTFQVPKLAFFLPDNKNFIKDWTILDIKLNTSFINKLPTKYHYFTAQEAKATYKARNDKWAHKGTYGHSLIIGGSYGKIGAPTLSAKAALKIGSGLVTAYIPKCGYTIMQTALPEVMAETDHEIELADFTPTINATVIEIGPGMGTSDLTLAGFKKFLQNNKTPLVVDADALNCLALNKELLTLLPKNSILTPHPKELERLIGKWDNDYEKLEKIKIFVEKYSIILVVKGAYTLTATKEAFYFNSTGNNALATAGSGDVLTGIITGLLAQGYSPREASCFGVYIHGRTAEIYTTNHAPETFTASLIADYLSDVILELQE